MPHLCRFRRIREDGDRFLRNTLLMRGFFAVLAGACALTAVAQAAGAAPPGCRSAEYRAFDFALGTWLAHNAHGERNGKAEVTRVLAGCSVRMHWTGRTYEGTNDNAYDASRGLWQKAWFDNTGGIELSEGRIVNRALVYRGVDYDRGKVAALHRESWIPLGNARMLEHYETSTDGGRTWKLAFDTTYVRATRAAYEAARIVQNR